MNVPSRAHRILKNMQRYTDLTENVHSSLKKQINLNEDDEFIGIYKNIKNSLNKSVVVTKQGIYLNESNKWKFIKYREIKNQDVDWKNKRSVDNILLTLENGQHLRLPIIGGDDKYRDAFEFLRYLDRVVEDKKS